MDKMKAVKEFFSHCVRAKVEEGKNPFEYAELEYEGWNDKTPNLVALLKEIWFEEKEKEEN